MRKMVVFVLGEDRPGIIAAVSRTLYAQGCNLEDISQTALQGEFVGIFMASMPDPVSVDGLGAVLREALAPMGLFVHLRPLSPRRAAPPEPSESFVITTVGPDRPGLVAGISAVLAHWGVNISNLKAVTRSDRERLEYFTIYQVEVPAAVDQRAFRAELFGRARELGLDVNIQHREIFEQVHRV